MLETVLENAIKAREIGREEGQKEKAINIAAELKKLNLSIEEISRATGLLIEEINKL